MNAQARLGAFVLIALIVLGLLSSRIGRFQWTEAKGAIIETILSDAAGIALQSPVLMAGVNVGHVSSITLEGNQALIQMRILPSIQLPASTTAFIAGGGLVGEKYIALKATPGDTFALKSKRIPAESSKGLTNVISSAASATDDIRTASQKASHIADIITAMLDENRHDLRKTTAEFADAGQHVSNTIKQHEGDIKQLLTTLPHAAQSGEDFFNESSKTMQDFRELLVDNRENLYRTVFELRKASENLAAFSDDIRRNPWKLMKEKPERKASKHQQQVDMEEMLLTTGRMREASKQP